METQGLLREAGYCSLSKSVVVKLPAPISKRSQKTAGLQGTLRFDLSERFTAHSDRPTRQAPRDGDGTLGRLTLRGLFEGTSPEVSAELGLLRPWETSNGGKL